MRIDQAVLLAAGRGSRLAPYTDDRPKCLVEVAGRPIVDGLLDALAASGVAELVVVTGYRGDALRRHLGRRRAGVGIHYVEAPAWETTNNICSLAAAAPAIAGGFLLLESDVAAEPAVVAAIAAPDRMAVAVYTGGMTGTGVRFDAATGAIRDLLLGAHRGDTRGLAKTVNFTSLSASTWAIYHARLAAWIAAGRTDAYYEAVLAELVAEDAVALRAADVTGLRWWEIDDAADLRHADALLGATRAA